MKLIAVYPDAYVFEESHRKESSRNRLTIVAHGGNQTIMLDGRSMDALQLAMRIRGWTQICALRSIRLAVCCSADPLPDSARLNADVGFALSTSLAARLSKILRNIEIHGYSGAVTSSCPQGAVFLCALLTRGYIEAAIEEYFIIRKDIEQHYHRVTFLNGMATRQRYPVLHEGGRDYGVL